MCFAFGGLVNPLAPMGVPALDPTIMTPHRGADLSF
jgi:hypothetical protein